MICELHFPILPKLPVEMPRFVASKCQMESFPFIVILVWPEIGRRASIKLSLMRSSASLNIHDMKADWIDAVEGAGADHAFT